MLRDEVGDESPALRASSCKGWLLLVWMAARTGAVGLCRGWLCCLVGALGLCGVGLRGLCGGAAMGLPKDAPSSSASWASVRDGDSRRRDSRGDWESAESVL